MAEILLYVTDEVRPDTAYQDGDIVCAFNDRRILCCHAEMHCHPRKAPRNGSGLILVGSLAHRWYERTAQYRFERVSATEVRRTVIATGESEIIGRTPNRNGEAMHVRAFVQRRKARPNHRLFGEDGAEVWYGGTTDVSMPAVAAVWDEIEQHSPLRRADHLVPTWLSGAGLRAPIADFSDAIAGEMTASEVDAFGRLVRKRRRSFDWRSLFPRTISGIQYDAPAVVSRKGRIPLHRELPFDRSALVSVKA